MQKTGGHLGKFFSCSRCEGSVITLSFSVDSHSKFPKLSRRPFISNRKVSLRNTHNYQDTKEDKTYFLMKNCLFTRLRRMIDACTFDILPFWICTALNGRTGAELWI